MKDENLKNKNFIDSSKNAFNGIIYTIKTQKNILEFVDKHHQIIQNSLNSW